MLERDEALAQLEAAAAAGGRVAVVTGEAGIGKTTLVRRFAEGRDVLWGACDDLTVPQPLGPLRDLDVEDGPGLLDALGVCVLEDCHWADEATLDVLAHVGRRIGRAGGLLVLTFRDDELALDHPLRRVVASIPPADVVRVPLAPLSREAVGTLGGDDVLYEATGGNPFLVTEAVAGRRATVRDAVLARAARLSPEARRALELVSVVPARTELWLLEDAAAAVDECEQGGLLVVEGDAVRFRHELARRAYRESLSALRRIELNRTVLRRLEQRGERPARLVHHAEAAQDHEALARHALVAAEEAVAARSHREAVDLLARALAHERVLAPRAARGRLRDAVDRGVRRRAQRPGRQGARGGARSPPRAGRPPRRGREPALALASALVGGQPCRGRARGGGGDRRARAARTLARARHGLQQPLAAADARPARGRGDRRRRARDRALAPARRHGDARARPDERRDGAHVRRARGRPRPADRGRGAGRSERLRGGRVPRLPQHRLGRLRPPPLRPRGGGGRAGAGRRAPARATLVRGRHAGAGSAAGPLHG